MIGTVDPVDYEIGKIPSELSQQPSPLIFFAGLNVTSNPVHNYIWESFAIKRASDRRPLQYQLMDSDCMIPPSKQKKSSYDWYVPKGILKTNWLVKHLHEVPSVVVLCFELDWDDVNFNDKKQECVTQVTNLRNQFINRSCRIALVLLQKSLTIPIEDALTTERASNLCDSCEISATSLFALPYQDSQHFFGYIYRMETAFFELASAYYQQEMKFIRGHREQLNKTNHGLLFVRHQFKLGFFCEMKQDFQQAIKNYKQAYANLMEIRSSLTNIYEIMTIAGFINYKVCRLLFTRNEPREAISHFQKHINIFRSKDETPELQFEHFAWLSKQYSIFGDLFETAITSGLVPSQILHPGYYYYEAALLSIKRRNAIEPHRERIKYVNQETALSIIEEALRIEFYGQRPWRPACQSLNPLDPEKEREGIKALQYHEIVCVNHSTLIINLLKNAMSQFKKNKCPRMMRFMIVLVGRQYYDAKDYVNCLNYLNQVLPFYRSEKWNQILVSILVTAFYSAYFSANLSEFVKLGIELLSSWIPKGDEFKANVQDSIFQILSKQVPSNLIPMENSDLEKVVNLWQTLFTDEQHDSHITIKMNPIVPFIEIKPVFSKKLYEWQETIHLKVHLLLNCPKPMRFTKLSLIFNEYFYNQFCEYSSVQQFNQQGGDSSSSLDISPMDLKSFEFSFTPRPQDAGKQLNIVGISLIIGTHPIKVICNWIFDDPTDQSKCFAHHSCLQSSSHQSKFYHISPSLTALLERRKPNVTLTINHETPSLLNDLHPIQIVIKNEDSYNIKDVTLSITRIEESSDLPVCNFLLDGQILGLGVTQNLSDSHLAASSTLKKTVYLPINDSITQRFLFAVSFVVDSNEPEVTNFGPNILKETIVIQTIQPFSVNFSTCNPLNLPTRAIRLLEPFSLKVEIHSLSPFPIELVDANLELNENIFHLIPYSPTNLNKLIKQDDKTEVTFVLYSDTQIIEAISLGQLILRWKKCSSSTEQNIAAEQNPNSVQASAVKINTIKLTLPQVTVENSLLYVETKLPDFGVTRRSLLLTYNLYNRTDELLPIHLSLGKSDNFMFAGNSSVKLSLPAKSKSTQLFVLYPLVCGQVSLPKLKIIAYPESDNPVDMDDILDDIVPSFLSVMPQEKIYVPFELLGVAVLP